MAETLSQNQIDDLLASYTKKDNYIEIQYQNLICIHCGKMIRCLDTDIHCLMTNNKCRQPFTPCPPPHPTHTFVSAAWLREKRDGKYACNRGRNSSLVADIKTQKIPKGIDGEASNKKNSNKKKYIRSPNETVIRSCSIWNDREP